MHLRKPWTSRFTFYALLLAALAQAVWITLMQGGTPTLDRIITATPIGQHSAVYEVLSDSGGATVGFTYLYFVHEKVANEAELLAELDARTAFLVTRQSGAIVAVEDRRISAVTRDTVYRYTSLTALREGDQPSLVAIELTSKMDRPMPDLP